MKKVIFLSIILLFALHINSYAQNGWIFQNPVPTLHHINSIKFRDSNTGILIGENNTLLRTTNSGLKWLNISNELYANYNSIHYFDSNIIVVSGNDKVIKSTDGGDKWNICYQQGGLGMHFVDGNTGFMRLYNSLTTLLKSTNRGDDWFMEGNLPTSHKFIFMNSMTGFCLGDRIYKTTNSGMTWVQKTSINSYLRDIFFIDQNTGYSVGKNGLIVKTINGGENWSILNSGIVKDLEAIYCISSNDIFAAGDEIIIKSSNSGITWTYFTAFQNSPWFKVINFINQDTGYTGGFDGELFKTTNGGLNWSSEKKSFFNHSISNLTFPSKDTGYVFLWPGLIGKTTNAGDNWFKVVLDTINAFDFPENSIGFYLKNNMVYTTTSGGNNWVSIYNLQSNFNQIEFLNKNTGFIGGNGIKKTINGGLNWSDVNIPISHFTSLFFLDNTTGFILANSSFYKTTDSGESWLLQYTYGGPLYDIYFPSSQTGYAVGFGGFINERIMILKTTDGGNSWSEQILFPQGPAYTGSVYFKNPNVGFVSTGSNLLYTTNGGVNWTFKSNLTTGFIHDVFFVNDDTGYVSGANGMILKTTNFGGVVTSVSIISTQIPSLFSLHQNYPNPFNPSTRIKFDIPKSTLVKLKIYDMLGRELAELVNQKLNAGVYEYEWSAPGGGLPSGVYFYRLQAGEFIETKRMVLVK